LSQKKWQLSLIYEKLLKDMGSDGGNSGEFYTPRPLIKVIIKDIRGLEEKDRFDVILANPPFGGKENDSIQQNFPIKSNATELLFLQNHFTLRAIRKRHIYGVRFF